jgi:uncharacterized protein
MNEQDIINLIKSDPWMMDVLHEAEKLNLKDWMIGAGFLRNKVWDYLHAINRDSVDTNDIDLVYFDASDVSEAIDHVLSEKMSGILGLRWEIKNQAYMHTRHNHEAYHSTAEGISHWVETATCVAVTLKAGEPTIVAPHGIDDLVNLIVRPTPTRFDNLELFYKRIQDKQWLLKWPNLKVIVD